MFHSNQFSVFFMKYKNLPGMLTEIKQYCFIILIENECLTLLLSMKKLIYSQTNRVFVFFSVMI